METIETLKLLQRSPHQYFKDALEQFKQNHLPTALQSLDAAIVFSLNSPFYIYQKIRLLYQIGAPQSCNEFIVSQLEYLYKQGSLYILCRSIDYLQKATPYSLNELRTLLYEHGVPYCLADFYDTLLLQKEKPFFELAEKAMLQDHYELCLCYCNLYLKLHKSNPKLCYMQGYCHHMLGHLIHAKAYYQEYLNFHQTHAKAYVNIGLIAMELGDYKTALEHLLHANTLEPDNPNYEMYLGECYYLAKKYNEAVAIYERMINKEPNNLQNYFNLSHTYKKMSKNRLSRRYTKRIKKYLKNRV